MTARFTASRITWVPAALGVAVAAVLYAFLSGSPATAVAPPDDSLENTGLAGCTRNQMLRISVANLGRPDTRGVRIRLSFHDSQGMLLMESTPTVAPGKIAFADPDCGVYLGAPISGRRSGRAGAPPG